MKAHQALARAGYLAVLAALAWFGVQRVFEGERSVSNPIVSGPETLGPETTSHDQPKLSAVSRPELRLVVPGAPISSEAESVPPEKRDRLAFVDARFVDEVGTPWSGVLLLPKAPLWLPSWNPGEGVVSGADGFALLSVPLPSAPNELGKQFKEVNVELVVSRPGCAAMARSATLREGETSHLGVIVLTTGIRVVGRTVDQDGVGFANAKIGVAPDHIDGDAGQIGRHGSPLFASTPGTTSSLDGSFTLEGVTRGNLRLWAQANGFRYSLSERIEASEGRDVVGVQIVMHPLVGSDRIAGQVVDPDGAPLSGISLRCQEHWRGGGVGKIIGTDREGKFEFLVEHDDSIYHITASDFYQRFAAPTVEGVKPGTLDLVIRMIAREQLAVRVRDAEGLPVKNALFRVAMVRGGNTQYVATAGPPGDYLIARPEESFLIDVSAKGYRTIRLGTYRDPLVPERLASGLDVTLQRAKRLNGRVTADGAPLPGVRVYCQTDEPDAQRTVDGYRYRYRVDESRHAKAITDADGRYELDCDVEQVFWLRAIADGWAASEIGPIQVSDVQPGIEFEHVLTRGGAIKGRVLLPDGRDAEGTIVALNHGDGYPITVRAGIGGVYHVDGLAVGKWQVSNAANEISPDRTRFASVSTEAPLEWNCEVHAGATTHFDLDLTRQ